MGNYRDLTVWHRAHKLALAVYKCTAAFPDRERYGLTSQLRRAAISITSNIAEGGGRGSDGELTRFLRIARGSTRELECQLLLCRDLGIFSKPTWSVLNSDCQEISKMLQGLINSFKAHHITTSDRPNPRTPEPPNPRLPTLDSPLLTPDS